METIVESDFMQAVDKELLYYLAHRYNKTPEQIISKFLIQENLSHPEASKSELSFTLENNEMEILRTYYSYLRRGEMIGKCTTLRNKPV